MAALSLGGVTHGDRLRKARPMTPDASAELRILEPGQSMEASSYVAPNCGPGARSLGWQVRRAGLRFEAYAVARNGPLQGGLSVSADGKITYSAAENSPINYRDLRAQNPSGTRKIADTPAADEKRGHVRDVTASRPAACESCCMYASQCGKFRAAGAVDSRWARRPQSAVLLPRIAGPLCPEVAP
jgi:hypothetical protein